MVKRVCKLFCLAVIFNVGMTVLAHAESLTAQVDRTDIGANETLTLSVRFEGAQAQGSPDFASLLSQFDILSNQKSSQHSIINGQVSVSTDWVLMLAPKRTGQILIPPFKLQGQISKPITITVSSQPATASGHGDVFIETLVDKDSVYINEQFVLTYRLYFNQSVESLQKPDVNITNARVSELSRVDYQKRLGQTPYGVAEYRYLVFPDATGEMSIDAQTWTVSTTDQPNVGRFGMGLGRIKRYRPQTEDITITVKPKPDSYPANAVWLPATGVTISERWSREPSSMTVGEPITWTITISAQGVNGEQLPPVLSGLKPNGFKIYPDQPSHETNLQAAGVDSTRTESVAIVPNAPGELQLPAVELSWWDTNAKEVKVATLPARTVFVAGATNASPQTEIPAPAAAGSSADASNTPAAEVSEPYIPGWVKLLLMLLVLTNLIALALWWRSRSAPSRHREQVKTQATTDTKAFKALVEACGEAPPAELRQHLLTWGAMQWPTLRPVTIAAIATKCAEPRDRQAIMNLDKLLFAADTESFDRSAFKIAVTNLKAHHDESHDTEQALRPLYAN